MNIQSAYRAAITLKADFQNLSKQVQVLDQTTADLNESPGEVEVFRAALDESFWEKTKRFFSGRQAQAMTGQARFGEENEPQQLRIVKDERFVPRETFDYRSCDDGTSLLTHSETSGPGILTSVQELKMDSRGNFLQLVEFERLNGGETEHRVSSFEACPSA